MYIPGHNFGSYRCMVVILKSIFVIMCVYMRVCVCVCMCVVCLCGVCVHVCMCNMVRRIFIFICVIKLHVLA